MAIEFVSNFDPKKLNAELRAKRKKDLGVAVSDEVTVMIERTQQQKGIEGGRFKQLTKAYARYKARPKRDGTPRRPPVPDLTLTGKMLQSIQSKVEETPDALIGIVYFDSTAEAEKARGNSRLRKFFGFARKQIDNIRKKLGGK